MPQHSITIPGLPADLDPAYAAARRGLAVLNRSHRGRIMVRGKDRASFLHGLLTNDITALGPGQGCYAAYLTPQGRMITDMYVYELGDRMILALPSSTAAPVRQQLDRLIFAEDVQLEDATRTDACIGAVGPQAAATLRQVVGGIDEDLDGLLDHASVRGESDSGVVHVVRTSDVGVPGFDVYVGVDGFGSLMTSLREAGAVDLDGQVAEVLRIEAGIPLFGADMTTDTIPLEAGIEGRAISFTKGCYVGQEVIVRVLHRGHGRVARKLVGLQLSEGSPPPAGAEIAAAGKDVGYVTSSVLSPAVQKPIALGYVHRDIAEPGTEVSVSGAAAIVTPVPFVGP